MDIRNGANPIILWVLSRYSTLIHSLELELRAAGFEVFTRSTETQILTHIRNDRRQGSVDVTRMAYDIATCDGEFDSRLVDPAFEINKIRRAINNRVEAIKIIFNSRVEDDAKAMDDLRQLSRDYNIRFVVARSLDS